MISEPRQRRVPHVCPTCGHIRHLRPGDAQKTKQCLRCHCQSIAPLGFEATARLYGKDFAIRAAARKRKKQPSSLEQQVEVALMNIPGIAWEREYTIEREEANPHFVDFAIHIQANGRFIALEVDGTFAHRNDGERANLRTALLFLFFDDVIHLSEVEIKRTDQLDDYLRQLLF